MAADTVENNSPWYYYLRRKGINWKIGLVDQDGAAIDSGSLTLKLWYEEIPDEIGDDDDILPLHKEFIYRFAKGCAFEYLLSEGIILSEYKSEYEKGIVKIKSKKINQTQQPLQVKPITIVPKR